MEQEVRKTNWICLGLLVSATLLCFLPRMVNGPLRNWDEAWYAQVSRETTAQDSWPTLRWNDHNWFEKPPLTFWITGAIFRLLGESEITARLLSVLCGIALCLLVFRWIQSEQGSIVALIGTLLLLSIPDFSRYVARGQMDAPITLLIGLSLWSYQRAWTNPNWHWLSGACIGIGFMTKGSVAAFGWIIMISHSACSGNMRRLFNSTFVGSILLAFAIAAPWHIHQSLLHGKPFLIEYLGRHVGQLFSLPDVSTAAVQPPPYEPFFYVKFLLSKFAIWGWLTFTVLAIAIGKYIRTRDDRLLLAICWFAVVFIVLSVSRMKRGWYLFALYPSIALMAAPLLRKWIKSRRMSVAASFAAACGAFVTLGTDLARPLDKEFEPQIAHLADWVQSNVAPNTTVCTLQTERAKESIYPIAARYYFDRHVQPVVGIDEMRRLAVSSDSQLLALVTEQSESRLMHFQSGMNGPNLQMETLARQGCVKLVRIQVTKRVAGLQKTLQ